MATMNTNTRDKALALLREASGNLATARLRIEQDMPGRAAETVHDAEKKLMDARYLLSLASVGADKP